MLVDFFPTENIFSTILDFHFCENPRFHDEFQALKTGMMSHLIVSATSNNVPSTVHVALLLASQTASLAQW